MIQYPIPVFIDTNVFLRAKHDYSNTGSLALLRKYVVEGKVKIYVSAVVIGEIKTHISEAIDCALKEIRNAQKEINKVLLPSVISRTPMRGIIEEYNPVELKEMLGAEFSNMLIELGASILDNSGVDVEMIMSDYFQVKPPFEIGTNKKHEFPDAVMISKLKCTFSSDNPILVVTDDRGYAKALRGQEGISTYERLSDIFDIISANDRKYAGIRSYIDSPEAKDQIATQIHQYILYHDIQVDGIDYDRKGIVSGYEYDETDIADVHDVTFKIGAIDEIGDDFAIITLDCIATIDAECSYNDYDNAYFDKESGEYIFLERITLIERHNVKFASSIKIEIHTINEITEYRIDELSCDIELNQDSRIDVTIIASEDSEGIYTHMVEEEDDFEDAIEGYVVDSLFREEKARKEDIDLYF